MHGCNSGSALLVNAEVDFMGRVVDGGVGIGVKTSPHRSAIEQAQAELRQEYDVREERRRELDFLEKGGNPLDFKYSNAVLEEFFVLFILLLKKKEKVKDKKKQFFKLTQNRTNKTKQRKGMSQPPSNQIPSNFSNLSPMNNNNNTTRMDANPIQNNNINDNDNKNNNNKIEIEVYIISKRVKPSKRITFTSKEDVQRYLLNLPYQLTPDHFLYEISKERKTEEYFITKLFNSFLRGTKIFGSLHHFNQILTMTSDEFNLLVHGNGSENRDSQTRKIKESLSEVSPDFVFSKLCPGPSLRVIEFLNFHNNINNNNNNNNNINNNNNNNNNDNNYNNNDNDNNNYLHVEQYNNNDNNNNENLFDDNDHQNNNNDDPMLIDNESVMELFPPKFQPDLNLPYDPFDRPSIGRDGEGFDGEIVRCYFSMEQVEFYYSKIRSNLIRN